MLYKKIDFSLIIPCFNEEKNIPNIIRRSKKLLKKKNFELILVNNGSTDNTNKILKKFSKLKNVKSINIKKNIGFGHGVMQGLKSSKGNIIGYTHADYQTDPNDFLKAIQNIDISTTKKVFYKGLRVNKIANGWSLFDIILTTAQSIFQSIFLFRFLYDIHSQPNVFSRSLIYYKKNYPKDFQIDTFFYFLAKKYNYKIHRFNVVFNKFSRGFGEGNNDTFKKKLTGIFEHIIGTFALIKLLFL